MRKQNGRRPVKGSHAMGGRSVATPSFLLSSLLFLASHFSFFFLLLLLHPPLPSSFFFVSFRSILSMAGGANSLADRYAPESAAKGDAFFFLKLITFRPSYRLH